MKDELSLSLSLSLSELSVRASSNRSTRIFYVEKGVDHVVGLEHQENRQRLLLLRTELTKLVSKNERLCWEYPTYSATLVDLLMVHELEYLEHLQTKIAQGAKVLDADTRLSQQSWIAACKSAGAVIEAVDSVVCGRAKNAFVAGINPIHWSSVICTW